MEVHEGERNKQVLDRKIGLIVSWVQQEAR